MTQFWQEGKISLYVQVLLIVEGCIANFKFQNYSFTRFFLHSLSFGKNLLLCCKSTLSFSSGLKTWFEVWTLLTLWKNNEKILPNKIEIEALPRAAKHRHRKLQQVEASLHLFVLTWFSHEFKFLLLFLMKFISCWEN